MGDSKIQFPSRPSILYSVSDKGLTNLLLVDFLIYMCVQYFSKWQRSTIRGLIENAILEADARGIKVLSLGLLNQVIVTLCNL